MRLTPEPNGPAHATRAWRFLVAVATLLVSAPALGADGPRYNRDVRPILADACFRCHGTAAKKGGLRLDDRGAAIRAADSGAVAVVPGKVDESEILRRIFSTDPDEVMPPPSAKKALTAVQKETLKQWVASGAAYEKHWAFETPVKPPLPKTDGPAVNPIDAFLNQRLQREGLTPAPEADRPTLIRRVAFALTGLPPTPTEVDAFVKDASTRAYENLVERYLHSPRFGEEMARHWLDVARYADTHGLHLDNERQMWLYRDYVVRAFNDGLPFDHFTTEQIAGDLIPNAGPDQLIATGFHRCNVTTGEGGSIESEWVFRNAVDRTTTMAETWLGVTAGCAVCHDHKYDPISAEDFYKLNAFFLSAAGPALDGNVLAPAPELKSPTQADRAKLDELARKVDAARASLDAALKSYAYNDPAGAKEKTPAADDPQRSFLAWLAGGGQRPAAPPAEIRAILNKKKAGPVSDGETESLRTYYLKSVDVDAVKVFKPLADALAAAEKERTAFEQAVTGSMVFREMETPREAFVMLRGQYDKPGKKVEPGTLSALPPLKKADPKARATRLDLAAWLLAPENPLTARVAVNRFWQQFFSTGLVKTSYDFGTQGETPTHPELLDWLAVNFRETGWDVRAVVRLMVNSAAFRRASRATPELLQRDPDNRLYARGPRLRLDAEQVRDNALAVAGLIDLTMGGRGVRPYQPPNIWEPVAFTGSNTREYVQDHGASLYRRSLYVFLKRTAPAPFMANFDAPSREAFCTRRERSNTPLQALQLMNDVQHVEAARALAGRVLDESPGPSPRERITLAFRLVLARAPEDAEVAVLEKQLAAHLARFQGDPASAAGLIAVGESKPKPAPAHELAAWTLVANTLLNLDETVNRN